MTTKTITVTENAYRFLKSLKSDSESFSDLLIRLGKEKSVAEKYFGVLSGDGSVTRKNLRTLREELSADMDKRHHALLRHQRGH